MEVDLFENYEQEFRNAYAQINKKLTSFQDLVGEEKYKSLKNLLKELDEIYELLEQMELELRDQTASQRGKLQSRVKSYRKDVEMLEKKLKQLEKTSQNEITRGELFGGGAEDIITTSNDQRQRLLNNTERLENLSDNLTDSYKLTIETEEIGAGMMAELYKQRETIQHARTGLRKTDQNLQRSNRVLTLMIRRVAQNKMIVYSVSLFILFCILFMIYWKFF